MGIKEVLLIIAPDPSVTVLLLVPANLLVRGFSSLQ